MFYIGLDIHTTHITICILDKNGKLFQRNQVKQVDQMMAVLNRIPDQYEVCYEASASYGRFYELLKPVSARVAVAHPGLLRLIFRSKKKNDRADAQKLAKLLYMDEVPAVHVRAADVRAWRELIVFEVEKELWRFAKDNAAVTLLRTIPGVGLRTAEAVVAFLDDPHRFSNSKKVGAYFGLVPSQDQSGSKNK